jgi:hypothetical protein
MCANTSVDAGRPAFKAHPHKFRLYSGCKRRTPSVDIKRAHPLSRVKVFGVDRSISDRVNAGKIKIAVLAASQLSHPDPAVTDGADTRPEHVDGQARQNQSERIQLPGR